MSNTQMAIALFVLASVFFAVGFLMGYLSGLIQYNRKRANGPTWIVGGYQPNPTSIDGFQPAPPSKEN